METKRVAIEQLSGAALDWAVAQTICPDSFKDSRRADGLPHWSEGWLSRGSPSRDWSQCGPLMDKYLYRIDMPKGGDKCWAQTHDLKTIQGGPNRLTAACRAIVAAHNPSGYVEVPVELLEPK